VRSSAVSTVGIVCLIMVCGVLKRNSVVVVTSVSSVSCDVMSSSTPPAAELAAGSKKYDEIEKKFGSSEDEGRNARGSPIHPTRTRSGAERHTGRSRPVALSRDPRAVPPSGDPRRPLSQQLGLPPSIGIYPGGKLEGVRLRLSSYAMNWLSRRPLHATQRITDTVI
jgi:hypothetical protein